MRLASPSAHGLAFGLVLAFALVLAQAASAEPLRAGFSRSALQVPARGAAARASQLFLWYPTRSAERAHDYDGQQGSVAVDAPVAAGAHPAVVFSHGYLGAGDQSIFLCEALARAGYVVAALDHADSSRGGTKREPPQFAHPERWDERKFRDRAEDLRFLIDHVLARASHRSDALYGHVDAARIGGVGHSLGGYALLGMAGVWPTWRDDRLRALALLSPYVAPLRERERLDVRAPVMLQGGTFDIGVTPLLPGLYARLAAPKYYAVLRAENHFGWTNLACLGRTTIACAGSGNPREIVSLTRAFLDRHLRDRPAKRLNRRGNLASYQAEVR